jgi:hypothetical protein
LAEDALASLEAWDPNRASLTALLQALKKSPAKEYCDWSEHSPKMAAALVNAGQNRQRRLQIRLAHYLVAEAHAA